MNSQLMNNQESTTGGLNRVNTEPAIRKTPSPQELKNALVVSAELASQIEHQRQQIRDILSGHDSRLLLVVGPCSVHDEDAVLEYAERLQSLNHEVQSRILIVMRAYVEKPRTSVGWKGYAYDPLRSGQGDMALGLEKSRRMMLRVAQLGLPIATEALNPLVMQYLDDLVSWTAIGARTSESQIHREMVSYLSMPVGIKNSTDGSAQNAINAMLAAQHSHHTLGVNAEGAIAMLDTPGNKDTHLVLRGGNGITNYDAESIAAALTSLSKAGCAQKVMVDCSHANACKQHERQLEVALDVVTQRQAGNSGIMGIMLESFLEPGRQNDTNVPLVYGQSITDPCLGWEQTRTLLLDLYESLA